MPSTGGAPQFENSSRIPTVLVLDANLLCEVFAVDYVRVDGIKVCKGVGGIPRPLPKVICFHDVFNLQTVGQPASRRCSALRDYEALALTPEQGIGGTSTTGMHDDRIGCRNGYSASEMLVQTGQIGE